MSVSVLPCFLMLGLSEVSATILLSGYTFDFNLNHLVPVRPFDHRIMPLFEPQEGRSYRATACFETEKGPLDFGAV